MSARNYYIMQSAVAPMQSELPCYTPLTNHRTEVHTVPLVMAADYAALEAECKRLRGTTMEVVTKNFAKNLGRAAKDKELDYYLSEGIRELQAERDALAAQLEGANERAGLLLDAKNHWAERARKAEAELAAIKGQSGFDYSIRTQSTNSIPAPAMPAVDIGRNAAFEACPDTGCDWSSFYRGWNAALAAIAKESQQ